MNNGLDFSFLEKRLREAAFVDWQGDFRSVWNRYVMIRKNKEAYMAKSPFRLGVVLSIFVVVVGIGIFGMGWLFQYQKANKFNQGEAILVTMTIGDVQVQKMGSDSWRELSVDEVVEMGDTLRTGNESACELQIIERGVYRLEANTEMQVAKLVNQEGNLQAKIHIDKGTMGFKPKKLKEGEVFEVETSTAVAAVRGTVFMVNVTEEGNTRVAVVEGKVSVKPKVTAIEKAKEEARVDTRVYDALQNAIAPAVEVGAEEEVVLQKEVVEKINQKVAEVINEKTTAGGPLTGEKVEEVKQSVVKEVVKEVVGGRSGETPSLVGVVVQKKVITEESKQILENVRQKEPVGKKRVKVSFSSDVPGTIVVIDGLKVGKVPFSKVVDVDATYTVVFEKEGYQSVSQEVKITSPTNIGVKMISLGASGTGVQEMVAQSSETNQQPEKPSLKPGEMEWEKPLEEMVSPTMVVVDRGGVDVDRMVWSVENRIVIMNLEGEVLKSFVLGKGNTYDFPVVATSTGIFARDDDGVVYGYDYNGNQKWLVKLPKSPAWTGLGVAKNKLIIPVVQNKVYVLSVELGEIVSTIEGTGQIYASPVMVDNKILVYAQENGMVVGYDMERGEELWRKDLGKRFVLPLYGCSEGEKKVAVLPIQGKLIAIDALSGNVVWEKEMVGATFATKPIARGRFLYVVNKNRLEVIDMLSGETRGKFTMASDIISFQVEKSKIYLLDATGQMKAFGPGGGVLWSYNAGSGGQGLAVHPEGVYVFTKKAVVKLVNELPEKK